MANEIHLGVTHNLSGKLTDDGALFHENKDWEKLLKSGVTAIQTDWPGFLNQYREGRNNDSN